MFDALTSQLLRSAPNLPELDASQIPQLLTRHYADLVSARLKGEDEIGTTTERWSLERIADAYEIIAAIEEDPPLRRAAAFVAGTAQQIISRRSSELDSSDLPSPISRDSVEASIAAAVLFLAAEQYADANEAAAAIPPSRGPYEIKVLGDHIRDLVRGRLDSILQRANGWRRQEPIRGTIQGRALRLLAATLSEGIELLAAHMMSAEIPEATPKRFANAQEAFRRVIDISSYVDENISDALGGELLTAYAGPAHLASLLLSAADAIEKAALTKLPPPDGADVSIWKKWLSFRAVDMPFVWQNHREAIEKGFYQTGTSAVLVLPTGAGKTTVSALKIAGALARGKNVIFLAPTHALVEQLTEDLQAIFPRDKFGLEVSSDFDSLLLDDAQLQDIEVMTPERCLAMLSFSASSFQNVGLLVFDECHLLSPQSGKIGRALDGMLCLLAFSTAAPDADMLFLSAMLKNGPQFSEWIADLTGRPCQPVDLLWKPSRQARGVVVYEETEINASITRAGTKQRDLNSEKGKKAKTLRAAAKREIVAMPYVVWGLQHNWISTPNSCAFTTIANAPLQLAGGLSNGSIWATPNANGIAVNISVSANASGLKTIVFVNTKADAVGTARNIAGELGHVVVLNESEQALWEALVQELGDSKHSIFGETHFGAVPHNASMLRLERSLSERLFRRSDGARVIVATPTLAQGLNLPAHLAILAGDKRAGENPGDREDLEAHELLNAAARAGRAGHLANGIVILIPEPLIKFTRKKTLNDQLKNKLASILPEDDRCVTITDPLEVVLDRLMEGELDDREVTYTINRLAALTAADADVIPPDNLMSRSLGAFLAGQRAEQEGYLEKVEELWQQTREAVEDNPETVVVLMASQSGLPLDLLERLRFRLLDGRGTLSITIEGWIDWTIDWLKDDVPAREYLLRDVFRSATAAAGKSATSPVNSDTLDALVPGIKRWITGKPLNEIETSLGGDPNGKSETQKMCPRARELISTFIPRGLSFIIGVVARMVEELDLASSQEGLDESFLKSLPASVRRGFDMVEKLEFANANKEILSRVQLHKLFDERLSIFDSDDDF
ncbi:DEAD/DEAH box helicase [Serratia marcescens]|uniref:DEAD/DEAH box helicase n=1 Tax=Serratia marcescens TaxID=615 RepID=UPI001F054A5A|nr:DEAD/DEAH box helicase [Serratia marcescens]MDM1787143.1 DEAD/DEAH box helicase [Serratia marcescens]MDM1794437.1 DEAD/DEAH box helicase [Serratia marcescens]MDM1800503.1 DEAD/DEAH box helicase [Serratia marcescens]MDM1806207.1 DEAD/DEAH box helicase [Serratia marcescens]MDM1809717.1 DEAD/DEAH box helicase [Serratia marcescens]